MSLPWVKLHTSLLDNEDYKRFSDAARHIYVTLIMLAGKQDRGDYSGRLDTATGPLKPSEIAAYFRYDSATFQGALRQLAAAGFISKDLTKTIVVNRFKEKSAPLEVIRARKNRRLAYEPNTNAVRTEYAPEAEAEVEVDYASLRSAVIARSIWPKTPEGMRELARPFVVAFANCKDRRKQPAHVSEYAPVLTIMCGRGLTIEQAWEAFEKAWRANDEEPLWRAEAKRALAQISSRSPSPTGESASERYKKAQGL